METKAYDYEAALIKKAHDIKGSATLPGNLNNQSQTYTFGGQTNKVYKRNDLIDLRRMDHDGKTNLELMRKGNTPWGPDNERIQLHHLTQTQEGALAEVTGTMHSKNHKILHIWTNQHRGGVTRAEVLPTIDRAAFYKWKREYWKARAKELETLQ